MRQLGHGVPAPPADAMGKGMTGVIGSLGKTAPEEFEPTAEAQRAKGSRFPSSPERSFCADAPPR